MKLLNDEMLCAYVNRPQPLLVEGLEPPKEWFDKDSPVQPSSIDLHIGVINLPGTDLGTDGAEDKPLTAHTLKPGQTAVITTHETLNLPNTIAAIGFPPSKVSKKGILMTNPGHVDPGYRGPLHFTVINMSRQDFPLRRGGPIVTVLFFEMSSSVKIDYRTRTGGMAFGPPKQEDISLLSADFLDVEKRAEEVAKKQIESAGARLNSIELQLKTLDTHGKIALAVISVLLAVATYVVPLVTGMSELKAKVDKLDLDKRVAVLELRLSAQPASTSPIQGGTSGSTTPRAVQPAQNSKKE